MPEAHASQWDYHVEVGPTPDTLAKLGEDGWELAAIDPKTGGYVFKRPRPSLRERVTLDQKARLYGHRARLRESEA